ncbi:hypothetical protein FA15DRAFT_573748, partial [Coprinopsis marcescibilis]
SREQRRLTRRTTIACSQVCRYWRHAALGYNRLWVHVVDFQAYSLQRNLKYIDLCHPYPFNVGHHDNPLQLPGQPGLFDVLLHLKDRILEWNVDCEDVSLCRSRWYRIFASSLMSTEGFHWKGRISSSGDEQEMDIIGHRFPMPLQRLSLTACNLLLYNMRLHRLTELHVEDLVDTSSAPDVPQWLDLLRGAPNIQLLSIQNSVRHQENQSIPPNYASLDMPCLRLISLGEKEKGDGRSFSLLPFLYPHPLCGFSSILPDVIVDAYLGFLEDFVRRMLSITLNDSSICDFPLHLYVGRNSRIAIGNVHDPEYTLDWNGPQDSKDVLEFLNSRSYNVISLISHSSFSRSFFDNISIFSDIVYHKVTALHCYISDEANAAIQVQIPDRLVDIIPFRVDGLPNVKVATFNGQRSFTYVVAALSDNDAVIPALPSLETIAFRNVQVHEQLVFFDDLLAYLKWR